MLEKFLSGERKRAENAVRELCVESGNEGGDGREKGLMKRRKRERKRCRDERGEGSSKVRKRGRKRCKDGRGEGSNEETKEGKKAVKRRKRKRE